MRRLGRSHSTVVTTTMRSRGSKRVRARRHVEAAARATRCGRL